MTATDKLQMWNAINKINAFLSEYGTVFMFYGDGFEDGSADVRLSARLGSAVVHLTSHFRLPPVRSSFA